MRQGESGVRAEKGGKGRSVIGRRKSGGREGRRGRECNRKRKEWGREGREGGEGGSGTGDVRNKCEEQEV